jgi:hypothetical protein
MECQEMYRRAHRTATLVGKCRVSATSVQLYCNIQRHPVAASMTKLLAIRLVPDQLETIVGNRLGPCIG